MFYMYHQFKPNVGKYFSSSWWCSSHFKHMLVKLDHSQVGVNIRSMGKTVRQLWFSYAWLTPLKSNEPGT